MRVLGGALVAALIVAWLPIAHAQTAGWEFPAVSAYSVTSADNGKALGSDNAPGASITVLLPAASTSRSPDVG
jgi:hypothetical protein